MTSYSFFQDVTGSSAVFLLHSRVDILQGRFTKLRNKDIRSDDGSWYQWQFHSHFAAIVILKYTFTPFDNYIYLASKHFSTDAILTGFVPLFFLRFFLSLLLGNVRVSGVDLEVTIFVDSDYGDDFIGFTFGFVDPFYFLPF